MTFSVGFVGVSTQMSRVSVADRGGQRVEVALVDHRGLEAPAGQHLVHEAERAAVEVAGMMTWSPAEQIAVIRACVAAIPLENAVPWPPSSCPARARAPPRRVRAARVVVVLDELAGRRLAVRRGLVDRRDTEP